MASKFFAYGSSSESEHEEQEEEIQNQNQKVTGTKFVTAFESDSGTTG